jgi:hypothetical protein
MVDHQRDAVDCRIEISHLRSVDRSGEAPCVVARPGQCVVVEAIGRLGLVPSVFIELLAGDRLDNPIDGRKIGD